MVDARLADGSRLHAVIPPLAIDGPCVTIRRFGGEPVPLEAFAPGAGGAPRSSVGGRRGLERRRVRRHERGQDDAAERAVGRDPRRGAHRHDRGDRRAAPRAAARRPARGPAAERRGHGRGVGARAGARRAADAARSHRRRRGARRRGARHVAGAQHRSRRLAVDRARERRGRRARAPRDARAAGRDRASPRRGPRPSSPPRSTPSSTSRAAPAVHGASKQSPSSFRRRVGSSVRELFRWDAGGIEPAAPHPLRAARRPGGPVPDPEWFAC